MKSGFFWGMLGAVALMGVLTAVVPSPGATARPIGFLQSTDTDWNKAEQAKQWTYTAKGKRLVRVNVEVGAVHVIAGNTDEIVIRTKRIVRSRDGAVSQHYLRTTQVVVEEGAEQVTINDLCPSELRRRTKDSPRVELQVDITLPSGMAVESSMGAGTTTVVGGVGRVALQTKVGDISLERQKGVSGSIAVGTGDVSLGGEIGNLAVKTHAGEIRAKQVAATSAEALSLMTSTGSIWVALSQLPKRHLEARTGTGDITVELPAPLRETVALEDTGRFRLRGLVGEMVLDTVAGVGTTHLDYAG